MDPDLGFPLFLGLTVAILALVVWTGVKGRVRLHLPLVGSALASLGVTIWFAERLGERYDLEGAGLITPVHLTVAKVTTLAYLLPIATGLRTLRDRRHKRLHFRAAMLVLGMTLLTAVTGTWMLLSAERTDGAARAGSLTPGAQAHGDPGQHEQDPVGE